MGARRGARGLCAAAGSPVRCCDRVVVRGVAEFAVHSLSAPPAMMLVHGAAIYRT